MPCIFSQTYTTPILLARLTPEIVLSHRTLMVCRFQRHSAAPYRYGIAEAAGSRTRDNRNRGHLPQAFAAISGLAVQIYAGIEEVASRMSWRNH
jgi:hypothetical protein